MTSFVIGIAGGTCSGKTTFIQRLYREFGNDIAIIYYDNYYKTPKVCSLEERKKVNYDHPDALETDLLIRHIEELKAGKDIQSPIYDFVKHERTVKVQKIEAKKVMILDGIFALFDQRLKNLLDLKIFIEADADERILRRILRDVEDRGRELKDVIEQYLSTVKPMHFYFVEPTKNDADVIINGGNGQASFELVVCRIRQVLNEQGGSI